MANGAVAKHALEQQRNREKAEYHNALERLSKARVGKVGIAQHDIDALCNGWADGFNAALRVLTALGAIEVEQ
jgi:hypothetical protein